MEFGICWSLIRSNDLGDDSIAHKDGPRLNAALGYDTSRNKSLQAHVLDLGRTKSNKLAERIAADEVFQRSPRLK
jgi:hypothetical protein